MKRVLKSHRLAILKRLPHPAQILRTIGIVFAVMFVTGGIAVAVTLRGLPAPQDLFNTTIVQSTKIYDRTGTLLLYEIHGEIRRTVIPLDEIPVSVRNATIATEDANFYYHSGIDVRGIVRALLVDLSSGTFSQGGSTITQQLVKKSILGGERTITRKFREAVLSIVLESRFDKRTILELYLNQIPYGSNAYGIEAAAETYFGKRARDLSLAESALLVGLPRAPSYYSPYGQHANELHSRKNYILDRMAELGYVTTDQAAKAKKEQLKFLPATKNIRAPHFVMYVRDFLVQKYGEDQVEQGGLAVTTTLDWPLQERAEKIVSEGAAKNEKLIQAYNMALVAIDPKSGDILSMVGSRDYFDVAHEGNFNVATAFRQPGSAFKPFVYATAFRKGFTPQTVVFDVPTEFNPLCTPEGIARDDRITAKDCYHPQNYDDAFRGPVTLRRAIAESLNVPSVKVLWMAGINDSIDTAETLGITTLKDRPRFGLSLVLGGAEVRLLDMTSAYSAFANDGVLNSPSPILKVETTGGRVLEERHPQPRPVIDPEVARTINDVLSDNDARQPTFAPRSSLYFPDQEVAVKTGTTQDYHDAWTIGYTPSIAIGVWAGNNDNTAMRQKGSGVLAAAPSWHAFMEFASQQFPKEDFIPPAPSDVTKPILKGVWQGDTIITIDSMSGKRATDFTPLETRRDIAFGSPHDSLYWINRSEPTGPVPADPFSDPQYANWETSFQQWFKTSGVPIRPISEAPSEYDDIHTPENQPKIQLEKLPGAHPPTIRITSLKPYTFKEIVLLSPDERIIGSYNKPTLPLDITVPDAALSESADFEIRAYDVLGNMGSATITLP